MRRAQEWRRNSQPDQVAHHIKIHGLQHFRSSEKSHCDAAGVHWAKWKTTQRNKLKTHSEAIPHKMIRWIRLGFMMWVRKATTASFGIPNDITPGPKPITVQNIALECWLSVSTSKCLPLPVATAAVVKATAIHPNN